MVHGCFFDTVQDFRLAEAVLAFVAALSSLTPRPGKHAFTTPCL